MSSASGLRPTATWNLTRTTAALTLAFVTRIVLVGCILLWSSLHTARAEQNKMEKLMEKLMKNVETFLDDFATTVQDAYRKRCKSAVWSDCEGSQYNSCGSAFPNGTKTCPSLEDGNRIHNRFCGDGTVCNGVIDFSRSAVRVPEIDIGAANDPKVAETVCFGLLLDDFMKTTFDRIQLEFESILGVSEAPFLYFGASDGAFRIYPARPSDTCSYDPRARPWYPPASSTQKAVVIILDTSESEDIEYLKAMAAALVNTLMSADKVSIVFMGDNAKVEHTPWDDANSEVRAELGEKIQNQEMASLHPDAKRAFNKTFDLLESVVNGGFDCTVAVVLLTNGANLEHIPKDIILERKRKIEAKDLSDRTMLFFGYNTGKASAEHADILECRLNAVWTVMDSSLGDFGIAQNVRLFHEAFAFDLGRSKQPYDRLHWWSELYEFHTGGIKGNTAAHPVFLPEDNQFLGVVGIDMALEELDGNDLTDIEKLLKKRRIPRCGPPFDRCNLEALRRRARRLAGDDRTNDSVCPDEGTKTCVIPVFDRTECPEDNRRLPTNLWDNLSELNVTYASRACCNSSASAQCPLSEHQTNVGKAAISAMAAVIALAATAAMITLAATAAVIALAATAAVIFRSCQPPAAHSVPPESASPNLESGQESGLTEVEVDQGVEGADVSPPSQRLTDYPTFLQWEGRTCVTPCRISETSAAHYGRAPEAVLLPVQKCDDADQEIEEKGDRGAEIHSLTLHLCDNPKFLSLESDSVSSMTPWSTSQSDRTFVPYSLHPEIPSEMNLQPVQESGFANKEMGEEVEMGAAVSSPTPRFSNDPTCVQLEGGDPVEVSAITCSVSRALIGGDEDHHTV